MVHLAYRVGLLRLVEPPFGLAIAASVLLLDFHCRETLISLAEQIYVAIL